MAPSALRRSWPLVVPGLLALAVVAGGWSSPSETARATADPAGASGLIRAGDRVAWVGSSSTRIGVWPRTIEFLLRTRHPGLKLTFGRFSTGGGTFRTGREHLDGWLDPFRPTVVVFNFGANDARGGREGLPGFEEDMAACVANVLARKARVVLITPQAGDVRKAGAAAAARRALYAETMLARGRENGWDVVDTHHPLDALQKGNRALDPAFSILKDQIHLTEPAYVAWGFYAYDRLDLPFVRGAAVLTGAGEVTATENCTVRDVKAGDGFLSFTRADAVLPILPPGPLPPRLSVPLEAHSRYLLRVTDLMPGRYAILCDGKPVGTVHSGALAVGVNLNSLLLDGRQDAPWADLARSIWDGKDLDRIGRTEWRFEVRKQGPSDGA